MGPASRAAGRAGPGICGSNLSLAPAGCLLDAGRGHMTRMPPHVRGVTAAGRDSAALAVTSQGLLRSAGRPAAHLTATGWNDGTARHAGGADSDDNGSGWSDGGADSDSDGSESQCHRHRFAGDGFRVK